MVSKGVDHSRGPVPAKGSAASFRHAFSTATSSFADGGSAAAAASAGKMTSREQTPKAAVTRRILTSKAGPQLRRNGLRGELGTDYPTRPGTSKPAALTSRSWKYFNVPR